MVNTLPSVRSRYHIVKTIFTSPSSDDLKSPELPTTRMRMTRLLLRQVRYTQVEHERFLVGVQRIIIHWKNRWIIEWSLQRPPCQNRPRSLLISKANVTIDTSKMGCPCYVCSCTHVMYKDSYLSNIFGLHVPINVTVFSEERNIAISRTGYLLVQPLCPLYERAYHPTLRDSPSLLGSRSVSHSRTTSPIR